MLNKEHLSDSGIFKIMSLKAGLNRGLTETTKNFSLSLGSLPVKFKKEDTQVRPLHLVKTSEFKSIDPNWISGFAAGDGSFGIKISPRQGKVNNTFQVEIRFRITQHIRDAHLLGVISEYLDCGKVYTRSNNLACDLEVFNSQDNIKKIIPFFNKYPIRTIKEKDFKDFSIVAGYIQNKDHLTPEGLALIRELKSNMNNYR